MADAAAERTIKFDYLKSPHYRVVHGDGAIGAVTPRGVLVFSIYSERTPIPTQVTHAITNVEGETAIVGDEILAKRATRDARLEITLDCTSRPPPSTEIADRPGVLSPLVPK